MASTVEPPFRIYYDGGNTYAGNPWLAPAQGVQVIVQRDRQHGRELVSGGSYYVWDDRGGGCKWWKVDDLAGLFGYLIRPGQKKVLLGWWVDTDEWRDVYTRAFNDPDFPEQTARYPGERGAE